MPPGVTDLGNAELEVLKALWDLGRAPVREVMNHLHASGRRLAYTTVLTVLTRLEQKGFVRADKSGVAYLYRPRVTRAKLTRSRLRSLIEQLYDGSAGPLVLQLVEQEKLSATEIGTLQKLVERLDREKGKPTRKADR